MAPFGPKGEMAQPVCQLLGEANRTPADSAIFTDNNETYFDFGQLLKRLLAMFEMGFQLHQP